MRFTELMAWPLLIWSGLTALVLSSWLLMVLRRLNATRYLPRAYWSCALFGKATDASLAVSGLLRMIAMATIIPAIYTLIFARIGGADALNGAIIGCAHGLLAGLMLPLAARRCAGALPPGLLGFRLGKGTPLVLLVVHAAYGALLGYIYVLPPT